jgi:hypothetical protein
MTSLKKQLNRITPARHYADNNRNEHYKFPLNWRESILYDETKKLPITRGFSLIYGHQITQSGLQPGAISLLGVCEDE